MSKQKLSAKEVMKDLRAGMSNAEIMAKYKISEKGLKSLFIKLSGAGVLTQAEIDARSGSSASDYMQQPIDPYTTPEKSAGQKIDPSVAKAVMEDKKAGLHDNDIMVRHELSPSQYRKIVDKLIEKGHLPQETVGAKAPKSTTTCSECGAEVPADAYKCPECGQWIESFEEEPQMRMPPPTGAVPTRPPVFESTSFEGDKECPWDERENYGTFNAYFQTATKILFTPTSFFSELPINQGYVNPILFGIMSVALSTPLGILFYSLWKGNLSGGLVNIVLGFFCTLAGAAIIAPIAILIWSGIVHGVLMLMQGANSGFQATLRVVAYSSVTQLFTAFPVVGQVASLYGLFLQVVGLRETHETSTGKSVAAVAIPFGIIVAIGVALFITARPMFTQRLVPGMGGMHAKAGVSTVYKGEILPIELCTAIDKYLEDVDSAQGLDKQSMQSAITEAWEELSRVTAQYSSHPNYVELKRTLSQHLMAIQLQAVFGNKMKAQTSNRELAIRDKLMQMCGK